MKFMFKLKPEIEAIPDDTPIPPPDDGRLSLAPKRSLGGVIEAWNPSLMMPRSYVQTPILDTYCMFSEAPSAPSNFPVSRYVPSNVR